MEKVSSFNNKKTKRCFLRILFILPALLFLSCSDIEEDGPGDMIWDFICWNVNFTATNIAGDNLIDSNLNIVQDVTVEYKGKIYEVEVKTEKQLKYLPPQTLGLRKEAVYGLGDYFTFGEFSPTSNYKGEEFIICWGNGRKDKVKFDLYITWKKQEPTVQRKVYVNGKEVSDDSLTANILIE